jgi:hypothetical protein
VLIFFRILGHAKARNTLTIGQEGDCSILRRRVEQQPVCAPRRWGRAAALARVCQRSVWQHVPIPLTLKGPDAEDGRRFPQRLQSHSKPPR